MQLFITNFETDWKTITIQNKEIAHQMKKVLRMKPWDLFFIQTPNLKDNIDQTEIYRYQTTITDIGNSTIIWQVTKTEQGISKYIDNSIETTMAIAMPNKRSKAELIVQKLSELWIDKIYFRPSQRSIINQANEKKLSRLTKIAQEATEQSRWRTIPHIEFIKDISKITKIQDTKTVIFDKSNPDITSSVSSSNKFGRIAEEVKDLKKKNIIWIILPEGWLTPNDYEKFWDNYEVQQLWKTILRTETASIIAWWEIKKLEK